MHMLDNMELTDHFRLYEFLVSSDYPDLAVQLCPDFTQMTCLHLLCTTVLEPARAHLGCKIRVSSGLRSDELNVAVGGHRKSLHMFGKAADIYTEDSARLKGMFAYIGAVLPFAWSQLIYYTGKNVIHVALPHPRIAKLCEVR